MHYARAIRHILAGTLIGLALVGLSATYWAVAGRYSLLLREDNPRIIEAQRGILRGGIYDRQATLLVETAQGDAGLWRRYARPSTYSIVGYYSLRYGLSGAESAFDALLSGSRPLANIADYFNRNILNQPQVGSDIMLSLDADIQAPLVRALDGAAGAAIVLDARNGAVLALASQPSFNPNTLDEDWSALIEAPDQPFFNRALQGNYQLGGNMYLVSLAQAIASGFDLSWRFTDATAAVDLGEGMRSDCVIDQELTELTLAEALAFGCPAAFASYQQTQSALNADDMLPSFAFNEPVTLAEFPQPEAIELASDEVNLSPAALDLRQALGQGDLTTTPLHLAAIIAAIANDGLAMEPELLTGLRPPDSEAWQTQRRESARRRLLDAEAAQSLQLVMREAWANIMGAPPADAPLIGAYIARSYSGAETQLWLNGFVETESDGALAFVILLEATDDLARILSVGRDLSDIFASRQ